MTTISSSEHVRLKLFARDAADIEVMSAYVQDMVLQVADMAHVSDQKRFVLLGNRFCWEDEEHPMRVRTALQIANVQKSQVKNIELAHGEAVLSILALTFEPEDALAGHLRIIFAAGGEIRLAVEACEAILEDISDAWLARSRPTHEID
jgi:hypothetical protein